MTTFLKYGSIRLALFLVPFALMTLVGWNPLIAGGLSLVFATLASYIFLHKQRDELATVLAERAEQRKQEREAALEAGDLDESVEDAILDEQESSSVSEQDAEEGVGASAHAGSDPAQEDTASDKESESAPEEDQSPAEDQNSAEPNAAPRRDARS